MTGKRVRMSPSQIFQDLTTQSEAISRLATIDKPLIMRRMTTVLEVWLPHVPYALRK